MDKEGDAFSPSVHPPSGVRATTWARNVGKGPLAQHGGAGVGTRVFQKIQRMVVPTASTESLCLHSPNPALFESVPQHRIRSP